MDAKGDYLYGAAADDYVLPRFFEDVMNMMETNLGTAIVIDETIQVTSDDEYRGVFKMHGWNARTCAAPQQFLD